MKKLILLTLSLCSLATLGATKGSLTNNDQVVTPTELTDAIKDKRDYKDLTYTQQVKRRGGAYVITFYNKTASERLKSVALPFYEERLEEGIYPEYSYQVLLNGTTYFLTVTISGNYQYWSVFVLNKSTVELRHDWTRNNDNNNKPSHQIDVDNYTLVIAYLNNTEIIEDVPDTFALSSDVQIITDSINRKVENVKTELGTVTTNATEALKLASNVTTLVYGDDCQLVSTNYNSATKIPSLFLRFKIKNEETGEMEWYKVWDELTRWNWLFDDYMPSNHYTKSELDIKLDEKADRAWGHYDSHTGNYAPDGFTWISSPSIAIAGGLAYQRILTTEGAVWVLESNGMTTFTGGETNGYFRISDDKGNALFEITKGTEQIVGATAGSVRTESIDGITHLFITYNVSSSEHPKLEICRDLKLKDWKTEDDDGCAANVSWTGSSGAWIAEVYGKTAEPRLFVQGTYKKGAKDVIKNQAPVSFTEIVINGTTYKVKVETMNGKNVLVLE